MTKSLHRELKKRDPFDSVTQEAALSILRTSDLIENRLSRLLRQHKLTNAQYNVLRILRGQGEPLPCLEIADRMIQVAPAITRVVDQLVASGLIKKTQAEYDRRVFLVELTATGKRAVSRIDEPITQLHEELLAGISIPDQKSLIRILESIRGAIQ